MILVYGSFMFGARQLAEFGFGLGFSVLVDAVLIRSLLVPALMHLIGPANWTLPGLLNRILPNLAIEAADPAPAAPAGPAPAPRTRLTTTIPTTGPRSPPPNLVLPARQPLKYRTLHL